MVTPQLSRDLGQHLRPAGKTVAAVEGTRRPLIHLVTSLRNYFGGGERRTLGMFRLLEPHADVVLWSTVPPAQAFFRYPLRIVDASGDEHPLGGTLVLVGVEEAIRRDQSRGTGRLLLQPCTIRGMLTRSESRPRCHLSRRSSGSSRSKLTAERLTMAHDTQASLLGFLAGNARTLVAGTESQP